MSQLQENNTYTKANTRQATCLKNENILIPNVAEKNILILVEEKKIT
jgi:hypothetical protein